MGETFFPIFIGQTNIISRTSLNIKKLTQRKENEKNPKAFHSILGFSSGIYRYEILIINLNVIKLNTRNDSVVLF